MSDVLKGFGNFPPNSKEERFASKKVLDLIDTYFYLQNNKQELSSYADVSLDKVDVKFKEILSKFISDEQSQESNYLNNLISTELNFAE
jgi:hypothetical protein